ncbi:MAG TPA: hypothetical protein VFN67_16375 [Polyangiales bacterium]|nr:hypothetical protein [Polyangiales bacterium]
MTAVAAVEIGSGVSMGSRRAPSMFDSLVAPSVTVLVTRIGNR